MQLLTVAETRHGFETVSACRLSRQFNSRARIWEGKNISIHIK